MKVAKHLFALMLVGLLGGAPGVAEAVFISVPPVGSNFKFVNIGPVGANTATVIYDALTETLTASADFGPAARPASLVTATGPLLILAQDFVGTFSLTSNIDNAGTVLGGSFTLTGQSATLGILAPTTLLSGSVLDQGQSGGILQMSGDVTLLDPILEAVVGPIGFAVLNFIGAGGSFADSFIRVTTSQSPDIFLVSQVTEPASLALFCSGLVSLILVRWRVAIRGAIQLLA
jgi:hypothetical protein